MLRLKRLSIIIFFISSLQAQAHAPRQTIHQKALLIGGGHRPLSALQHLKTWSIGRPHAESILVVTWASQFPADAFAGILPELKAVGFSDVQEGVRLTSDPLARQKFLAQLSQSSTIFFTGGDQSQFMKTAQTLAVIGDLKTAYVSGIAFAGTSAGTAVMAQEMFTGSESLTEIRKASEPLGMNSGLGFFSSLLIDQHFVMRMRWARLFNALLDRPEKRGLGVDEDTALAIET